MKTSKVYEISRESNQQRREYSSQRKKTSKGNASHLGKELPMSLVNSTKNFTKTTSTPKEEKQRLKGVSKSIKKCFRNKKREKRQQVIQRILQDFKGVSNIPGIKTAKRRVLITKIKNEREEIITSRKGTANVFGEFYKKLHDDNEQDEYGNESNTDVHISDTEEMTRIPEITSGELQDAIRKLKKR